MACVGRLKGGPTDINQRACWDDEIFAWKLVRQDALGRLVSIVETDAKASPESYPKISAEEDYSGDHIVRNLRAFDAEADKVSKRVCGIEVGLQGFDPNRGAIPPNAINTGYFCGIDQDADVVRRYLLWSKQNGG